jgi:hypothetical protein
VRSVEVRKDIQEQVCRDMMRRVEDSLRRRCLMLGTARSRVGHKDWGYRFVLQLTGYAVGVAEPVNNVASRLAGRVEGDGAGYSVDE